MNVHETIQLLEETVAELRKIAERHPDMDVVYYESPDSGYTGDCAPFPYAFDVPELTDFEEGLERVEICMRTA